jgi:hypothetical protein
MAAGLAKSAAEYRNGLGGRLDGYLHRRLDRVATHVRGQRADRRRLGERIIERIS